MNKIITNNSLDALSQLLAKRFIIEGNKAIKKHDSFHVVLSGGRSPQPFFSLLASDTYKPLIAWDKTHIYLSDERFVPHQHADSNFGMIKRILLDNVPIPEKNIHAIPTEKTTPEEAAKEYEKILFENCPIDNNHPCFDFSLLGIGEDGHVASLFPETDALTITNKMAVSVFVPKLKAWRISLTFPALNHSHYTAVIATGEKKICVVKHVLKKTEVIYPIQLLEPQHELEWYLDRELVLK